MTFSHTTILKFRWCAWLNRTMCRMLIPAVMIAFWLEIIVCVCKARVRLISALFSLLCVCVCVAIINCFIIKWLATAFFRFWLNNYGNLCKIHLLLLLRLSPNDDAAAPIFLSCTILLFFSRVRLSVCCAFWQSNSFLNNVSLHLFSISSE